MGGAISLADTSSTHHVHWRSPTSMLVCYVAAVFCAVGHHVLNLFIHGKAVETLPVDQQWVVRGGIALAYMVKVLLVLATGIAYCQCVWQKARQRPTKIEHFDILFGAMDNILELRRLRFWLRRPILGVTILVIWYDILQSISSCIFLLPVKTLLSTSDLSHRLRRHRLSPLVAIITPGTLSVIDKATSEPALVSVQQRQYGSGLYAATIVAENGTAFYGGARSYLKGPALATLAETEILSVGSYPSNMTYSLDFHGPAVKCTKAGDQITSRLASIIVQYQDSNKTTVVFDTWVPKPDGTSNDTVVDHSIIQDSDKNRDLRILDQTSHDASTIYYSIGPLPSTETPTDTPIYVIQCLLYNASWQVDFDVRRTGEQSLTPLLKFENWMPGWSSITPPLENNIQTSIVLDYAGLMETFGAITTGRLEIPDDSDLPFVRTSIALETSPILFADATPALFTDGAMIKLQRTLETIFQNLTLSTRYAALPQQELRGDTSMLTFLSVEATSTFARNVYEYKPRDLIISYTLTIVSSAVCIILAVNAIRDMGAVYSNNFSTAVRVSRAQTRLDHIIVGEKDRSGADPLPKRVAGAYIWVGRERKMGMGIGRGRVGTETTFRSQKSTRRWGQEKVPDLESPPEKPAAMASVKELKGPNVGNWI